MKAKLLLALIYLALIFSCNPAEEQEQEIEIEGDFIFDGVVRDVATNEPLKDVAVIILVGDGSFAFVRGYECGLIFGSNGLNCTNIKRDTAYTDSLGRYHFEIKKTAERTAYRFWPEFKNYAYLPDQAEFKKIDARINNYNDELYMSSTGKVRIKAIANSPASIDTLNVRIEYPEINYDFRFNFIYGVPAGPYFIEENGEYSHTLVTYYSSYFIVSWQGTSNRVPIDGRDSISVAPFQTVEKVIIY